MAILTLGKALNDGLRKALENDSKVLIMGEDVGRLGGVFRVTDGLQKDFGEDRVIDTPLAESGIVGTAIGLAIRGFQPGREDALPVSRQRQASDHHPHPVRRRDRRGRAPQRVAGDLLLSHAGVEGGDLLQPGRRLLDGAAGDRQ
jgi:hypothetical protein